MFWIIQCNSLDLFSTFYGRFRDEILEYNRILCLLFETDVISFLIIYFFKSCFIYLFWSHYVIFRKTFDVKWNFKFWNLRWNLKSHTKLIVKDLQQNQTQLPKYMMFSFTKIWLKDLVNTLRYNSNSYLLLKQRMFLRKS